MTVPTEISGFLLSHSRDLINMKQCYKIKQANVQFKASFKAV